MSLNSYYTPKLPDAMYVYDTPATNIQLLTLDQKKSLVDSTYYGINGGWFNLVSLEKLVVDYSTLPTVTADLLVVQHMEIHPEMEPPRPSVMRQSFIMG